MNDVTLSWPEVRFAAMLGAERQIRSIAKGRRPRFGQSVDALWSDGIVGALGELVVARVLNHYPVLTGEPAYDGDLGGGVEVRTTSNVSGSLIVHPDDRDDAPYVLVRGTAPRFQVVGWIMGAAAKQERWWRLDVRHPAYFVPAGALAPMAEFV